MSATHFGCMFCDGAAFTADGECMRCGKPVDVAEDLLATRFGEYSPVSVLGRGFFGWTLEVEDQLQRFSMKVVPTRRYAGASMADKEVKALIACSPHRHVARFVRLIRVSAVIRGEAVGLTCMVFEFIPNAVPLSRFLADGDKVLTKADVASILSGIASGLDRMHANELWHEDLHDDNILIRTVQADENLPGAYEAKLIDFGSVRPRRQGEPESGVYGDYAYLAKHFYNLILKFELGSQSRLTPSDRTFCTNLRAVAHRLSDQNIRRRQLSPADVRTEIRRALDSCATGQNFPSFAEMREQSRVSFSEPLENTNALSLAPQDIALLFRDSLGWSQRIVKSEPVLVVGPRGCGKTMFLRYLSIASAARPLAEEDSPELVGARLDGMRHVGFLVNVGQLRTPFLRAAFKKLVIADTPLAEDFCREFLSCHFAYEVVRTFIWLNQERMASLTADDLNLISSAVTRLLHTGDTGAPEKLESLAELLDRRVMGLSNLAEDRSYVPGPLSRDDALQQLAQAVRRTAWGAKKEVWFLLDDYSVTVLPPIAQAAYNPVLFRLSNDVRIKASSEGEGPLLTDTLGRKYREGRELTKLNLGEIYFQAKEEDGRKFFEEILEARFGATKRGDMGELLRRLGTHEYEDSFGEYICSLKRPGDARFYGFSLICRLCSGDVSFIIELLHALTRGDWSTEQAKLTPKQQDEIVKRFAQRQLADLHATAEQGEKLFEFAMKVGQVIKAYLIKSKGKAADERLRIEVEKWEELTPAAQSLHDALLRHSVLISGGSGKSKEGLPTRKFFFRRLFAPCFPFSPTRKGCIDLEFGEYQQWLLDPRRILPPSLPGDELPGLV